MDFNHEIILFLSLAIRVQGKVIYFMTFFRFIFITVIAVIATITFDTFCDNSEGL